MVLQNVINYDSRFCTFNYQIITILVSSCHSYVIIVQMINTDGDKCWRARNTPLRRKVIVYLVG